MKNSKLKVAQYATFPDEFEEDYGYGDAIKEAEQKIMNNVRNAAKREGIAIITDLRVQKGNMGGDFLLNQYTIVVSGFGYRKPRYIVKNYSTNKNRKKRWEKRHGLAAGLGIRFTQYSQ